MFSTFLATGVIVSDAIYPSSACLQDPLGSKSTQLVVPHRTWRTQCSMRFNPILCIATAYDGRYIDMAISTPRVSDRTMRKEWLMLLLNVRVAGGMKRQSK